MKSNSAKIKVVRTGQSNVLVRHAETEAPDVGDFEDIAKPPMTSRAQSKRVTKKPEALFPPRSMGITVPPRSMEITVPPI